MPDESRKTHHNSRIFLAIGIVLLVALVATMFIRARRTTAAVTLGAIPYSGGESWQYKWSQAGQPVGTMTMTISAGTAETKPVWVFNVEVRTGIDPTAKPFDVATVTADAVTLLPMTTAISTDQPTGHFDINVTYSSKEAGYTAETPSGSQSGATQLPGPTYDNDEMLMLIRALPLAQGYSTRLVCLQSRNIAVFRVTVKVDGQEDLTVGSEKIACWRVSLALANSNQTAWYATSPDHRLIRLDGPSGLFELQSSAATAGRSAMLMPIQ